MPNCPCAPHRASTPRLHRSMLGLSATLAFTAATCLPARADETYVNAGLPGITLGYAHTISDSLGLRADASSTGTFTRNGTADGIPYQGKVRYQRAGLFADYFVFGGRFRFSSGVTFNDAKVDLKSRFDGNTSVTINHQTITPDASNYYNAQLVFPKVTPYLGLGWGHQARASGFGFVGDIGVSIGRAKLNTSTNLVGKQFGTVVITQADVDAQNQTVENDAGKLRLLPQLNLGVSYRF